MPPGSRPMAQGPWARRHLRMFIYMYFYIYIYAFICIFMCIFMYICAYYLWSIIWYIPSSISLEAVRSQATEQQQRQRPRMFDQAPSTCAGMKYAGMDKSLPPIYIYIYILHAPPDYVHARIHKYYIYTRIHIYIY